jgi:hypothetical protein
VRAKNVRETASLLGFYALTVISRDIFSNVNVASPELRCLQHLVHTVNLILQILTEMVCIEVTEGHHLSLWPSSRRNVIERRLLHYLYDEPDASLRQISDELQLGHQETARRLLLRLRQKLSTYNETFDHHVQRRTGAGSVAS